MFVVLVARVSKSRRSSNVRLRRRKKDHQRHDDDDGFGFARERSESHKIFFIPACVRGSDPSRRARPGWRDDAWAHRTKKMTMTHHSNEPSRLSHIKGTIGRRYARKV
jgi:hypothetical protein